MLCRSLFKIIEERMLYAACLHCLLQQIMILNWKFSWFQLLLCCVVFVAAPTQYSVSSDWSCTNCLYDLECHPEMASRSRYQRQLPSWKIFRANSTLFSSFTSPAIPHTATGNVNCIDDLRRVAFFAIFMPKDSTIFARSSLLWHLQISIKYPAKLIEFFNNCFKAKCHAEP